MHRTLLRKRYQCRAKEAMSCQYETVPCPMQPKRQTATLVSSVSPPKPKQTDLFYKRLAQPRAKSVAQFSISSSNRKNLLLPSKNRLKADKLIEAQAKGNHLHNSKPRLYLHHSNFLLLLQTRRMYQIQHIRLVQGLTPGDDRTATLAASIL